MSIKRKASKAIKKAEKAVKKAIRSETAKEIIKREKLLAAEMLEKAAQRLKREAKKK